MTWIWFPGPPGWKERWLLELSPYLPTFTIGSIHTHTRWWWRSWNVKEKPINCSSIHNQVWPTFLLILGDLDCQALIHYPEICIDDYFLGARPKHFSGDSEILPSSPAAGTARSWGQPLLSTGNQSTLFLPTERGPAVQTLAAVADAQLASVSDSPSVDALYNPGSFLEKAHSPSYPPLPRSAAKTQSQMPDIPVRVHRVAWAG